MSPKLALLASTVVAALVPTFASPRAAKACTCAEQPARVLVPALGAAHVAGAPLVVVASLPTEARLYDPAGQPVELPLVRQWKSLGACGGQYFVYQPGDALATTPGEFKLRLGPESVPDVSQGFSVVPNADRRSVTLSAEIRLSYSPSEPYESSSGMCGATQLDGMTIEGNIEYTVTLSAPAPVFAEAWYKHPSIGEIRDYGSTFALTKDSTKSGPQTVASIDLPHVRGSDDCVELRLYSWTFETLVSDRLCFMSQRSQSYTAQIEMPEWNPGRESASVKRTPQDTFLGCSVAPSAATWNLSPLILVGLARLRRWRARR